MTRTLTLGPGDPHPAIGSGRVTPPLDAGVLAGHAPDRHFLVVGHDGCLEARASIWWRSTLRIDGGAAGIVGHFAADNLRAACDVLRSACDALHARGCATVVGPVDGNTWRDYRFVVDRGAERPFFLEPDHPEEWPRYFAAAGFDVLATYTSAMADDLRTPDPRLSDAACRLRRSGVEIRALDPAFRDRELTRIHDLSCRSFAGNFLFAPIGRAEFMERQRRLWPFIDPGLVLLAERDGALVGFLLGLPDLLGKAEGLDTVIVKTVAVLPGMAQRGLGAVLVGALHERAARRGFRRAVHALMHDGNISRNISRRSARPFRRYAVFSRRSRHTR